MCRAVARSLMGYDLACMAKEGTRALAIGAWLALGLACTKAPAPAPVASQPAGKGMSAPNAADLAKQVEDEAQEKQAKAMEKRPRFGEAAVYVDGKSVGVLRVLELPPSL